MWKYPPTADVQDKLNANLYPDNNARSERGYGDNDTSDGQFYQDATPESFAQTAQAYGGEAAYEQAKANDDTELDYRQWVQVRTPEFKAWFGDWENNPDNASKVVNERTSEPLVVYHGAENEFYAIEQTVKLKNLKINYLTIERKPKP